MSELVLFIAKSLVDAPDQVTVETRQDGDYTVIELHVVIGKQGRIAKAIRTVVKAASARENGKYMVEIV